MAANKFEELMSSDVAAAQALKEKLAKLEDQERAKDVKAHATKTSSSRKQWSSPLLLNQEATVSRTRDEMPPLSLNDNSNGRIRNGRPGAQELKFDAVGHSGADLYSSGTKENDNNGVGKSSLTESPALEAVVESVTTTSTSPSQSTSQSGDLDANNGTTENERIATRTTFAGGSRTR